MAAAATSADLPAHSVHSGHNSGGTTYVCRVHSAGGETGLSGSTSCAGPYHCMAAVGNKPYTPTVGHDVLAGRGGVETSKVRENDELDLGLLF